MDFTLATYWDCEVVEVRDREAKFTYKIYSADDDAAAGTLSINMVPAAFHGMVTAGQRFLLVSGLIMSEAGTTPTLFTIFDPLATVARVATKKADPAPAPPAVG